MPRSPTPRSSRSAGTSSTHDSEPRRPAPRTTRPRVPRTVEELLRVRDDEFYRHELIGGDYFVTPSPVPRHQQLNVALVGQLLQRVQATGLGEVFTAPVDVVLSPTSLVIPDLFVVLNEHRAIIVEKRIEGPPDLVVEITSPSTERTDRESKRDLHERAGVREYWIVLSDEDAVLRYVRDEEHAARFGEPTRHTERIELSIVDAEPIDLTRIW